MIILGTNLLPELTRAAPDAAVLAWLASHRRAALCTTAITEAELRDGIARLPPGAPRSLPRWTG